MRKGFVAGLVGLSLVAAACGGTSDASSSGESCSSSKTPVVTLAAYSTVYDVYGKLISAFQDKWKEDHDGQSVIFQTSFGGSTTQAKNVANGFPADIVALSLDPDVEMVQNAGLITHDWQKDADGSHRRHDGGRVRRAAGQPQAHRELERPDPVGSADPDARPGAERRRQVEHRRRVRRGDAGQGRPATRRTAQADAEKLLEGIFENVTVMDKSANDSLKNFQSGNGDVAISYENQ